MGIFRRLVKNRDGALTYGDEEIAARGVEIANLLARTVGNAAKLYGELKPDGRELEPVEAAAVHEQLTAVTTCLRSVHPDRDIIEFLAGQGRNGRDTDMRPTISVLRMMQRGFGLALSDDPDRRQRAMPLEELAKFLIPVGRFWRDAKP